MIDNKLLKIASNTRFYGLKNNYTYKTNLKNSICGDKISIEIMLKKNIIKELRFEKNLSKYLNFSKKVPKKFNNLTYLLKEKYMSRKDCILLPFKAFYKAIK